MRDAYVIGVGATPYGKLETTLREAACRAALDAIDAAGIDPERIDGAFVANALGMAERQGHLGPLVMTSLGIPEKPASTIEAACASGASAFREAYVNVAGGFADVYLAVGVEKVSGIDSITATGYFAYASDYVYEGNCGASFPGLYATIARAHMKRYGTTEEDLARVAVKNHENALLNDKAHLRKRITVEDVLKSTMVSTPLKMFDACPFSDGASAAIVATREVAERLGVPLVKVAGVGRAGSRAALPDRTDLTSLSGTKLAAKQALAQAKLAVGDVDFFELHDCFTIAELVAMEDLGLAQPGKAAAMVRDGVTARGGDVPVNASGGLKAKGHPVAATGLGQIYEMVNQIAGRVGGERQLRGARTGLSHNVGATGGSVAVTILQGEN
ncbi:MAG TPA: thiolase domain-containing protein [Candidatus Thermoplasmatota archaeon]|nr:thiolase domain-containing protein [Candidatus Thermoplasmatota archaeon]